MLKQINPEDLKECQEYYAKMKYVSTDNTYWPLNFIDGDGAEMSFTKNCPIYTLEEDQPIVATLEQTGIDPELEMLVNVATALMINDLHFTENEIEEELGHKLSEDKKERAKQWASAYKKLIAREAADLIAACKQIKEGER